MKRSAGFCALVGVLVWVCGSHLALSVPPGPPDKVTLCHVDKATGTGTVIEVAEPAIAAHCRNHDGDWTNDAGGNAPAGAVGTACDPATSGDGKTCGE